MEGYGPATITTGAHIVLVDHKNNLWRYKTGTTIDEEDISPLKLRINAIDENGVEIKKELTIPFEGGYKQSGGKDSKGSPGFEIIFLLIAIMIVIIQFNNSRHFKK